MTRRYEVRGADLKQGQQSKHRPRLIAYLNAYSQGISGGDTCFLEITRRLDGYETIVVTSELGKNICQVYKLNAQFWITSTEKKFSNIISTYILRTIKGLWLTHNVQTGDLLYATSDFLPDVLPAFWCKMIGKRVRWVQKIFHLIPSHRIISHHAQQLSHLLIKQAADLIIVDNSLLRDQLIRQRFPADRIHINYPGIDVTEFASDGVLDPPLYDAIFVGRLHRSKGIFDLIDIWQVVCHARPSASLAVIGRGDTTTLHALQRKVATAGLADNILLLGYLDRKNVITALRRSRIFVFPSLEEGFGLAILEAIAAGLPVVAWDLPIYREVFPVGLTRVPTGNLGAFAAAVLHLLNNPDEQHRKAAAGRSLLPRYRWQKIAAREAALLAAVSAPQ